MRTLISSISALSVDKLLEECGDDAVIRLRAEVRSRGQFDHYGEASQRRVSDILYSARRAEHLQVFLTRHQSNWRRNTGSCMYVNLECAVAYSHRVIAHGHNTEETTVLYTWKLQRIIHSYLRRGWWNPTPIILSVIDSGMAETSGGRGQAGMTNEAARSRIWFKGTSAIGNTSGAELERSPTCSALRDAHPGTAGLSQAQEHRPRAPTARLPNSSPKARPSVLRSRKTPLLLRSSSRPTYGGAHRE